MVRTRQSEVRFAVRVEVALLRVLRRPLVLVLALVRGLVRVRVRATVGSATSSSILTGSTIRTFPNFCAITGISANTRARTRTQ